MLPSPEGETEICPDCQYTNICHVPVTGTRELVLQLAGRGLRRQAAELAVMEGSLGSVSRAPQS